MRRDDDVVVARFICFVIAVEIGAAFVSGSWVPIVWIPFTLFGIAMTGSMFKKR